MTRGESVGLCVLAVIFITFLALMLDEGEAWWDRRKKRAAERGRLPSRMPEEPSGAPSRPVPTPLNGAHAARARGEESRPW